MAKLSGLRSARVVLLAAAALTVCWAGTARALEAYTRIGDAIQMPLGGRHGDGARGKTIVLDRTLGNCLICHRVPVASEPFQGNLGPDLSGVGARLGPEQIRLRVVDQSLVNPDTVMPPYYRVHDLTRVDPAFAGKPILDAQQVEDVVAWLSGLKETPK